MREKKFSLKEDPEINPNDFEIIKIKRKIDLSKLQKN